MSEIYENQYNQKPSFASARDKVNSKEQQERADFYISKYRQLKAEMQADLDEWERIEKLYCCEREKKSENDPNSFDPIILPVIEGQTATMSEKNISASVKGEGYSDQKFAHTGQILTDFAYRHIRIRSRIKEGVRRYLKFGNGCFAIGWNPDALDGFGLPEWRTPQPGKVFVDGKIKNLLDSEKAEYIIEEIGSFSILSARREYGDDKADAVALGNTQSDFNGTETHDDKDGFTKLYVWTRNNDEGNLQRLEISLCGIMLNESEPDKPFYEFVENQYPYKFFGLYPIEGKFNRFGDGKLLERLQILLNNLWDECVIAAKFSAQAMVFVDPNAGMDPDQLDGDPSHPIEVREPKTNIHTVQGQGLNQIVMSLVSLILAEIQRITRFSTLMMGSAPSREITATQSGIMVQQGNAGIDDKRGDISEAIAEATMYMLGLMMEFWPAAKAIRIAEESEETEWVDARQLRNIPAMIPSDSAYEKKWKARNKDLPTPQYMQLISDDGTPQTKRAMFDIQVSIGEGLPTNKLALLNVIMSLSKMVLPDELTGQPKSLLSYQQVQRIIEDTLEIPLVKILPEAQRVMGAPMGANGGTANQNVTANSPAATAQNPYIEGAGGATGLMSNQGMGAQ
jgi:hypothetical protein